MDQLKFQAGLAAYTFTVAPDSVWVHKGLGAHYFSAAAGSRRASDRARSWPTANHRDDLVAERTRIINRLLALHELDPSLQPAARSLWRPKT